MGARHVAVTNTFGYYRFAKLTAGESYVLSVQAKGYQFDSIFLSPTQSVANVDFISLPAASVQSKTVAAAPATAQPVTSLPVSTNRKVKE